MCKTEITLLIILISGLCFATGFGLGMDHDRGNAVRAGVGCYVVPDPSSSSTEWRWNTAATNKLPVIAPVLTDKFVVGVFVKDNDDTLITKAEGINKIFIRRVATNKFTVDFFVKNNNGTLTKVEGVDRAIVKRME